MSMSPEETAFEQGYKAYYDDIDDCPFDYDTENCQWEAWVAGHMEAYCIGEGK